MIIFLSQIFCSLFLYVFVDWIFESFPVRNGGGVSWERVRTLYEVVASVLVRTMGKGGQVFATLVRAY